jgi:molecular chaperone DnaJ
MNEATKTNGKSYSTNTSKANIEIKRMKSIVKIKEHEIFERRESNLFCNVTIDLATAIFGGEIKIPTIDGSAKLKIPPGTQSHTVFRLKGQGMPYFNLNKRGDQLVKVIVEIPKKLSKRQEQVLKKFISGRKIKTSRGFFDRLKGQFK